MVVTTVLEFTVGIELRMAVASGVASVSWCGEDVEVSVSSD